LLQYSRHRWSSNYGVRTLLLNHLQRSRRFLWPTGAFVWGRASCQTPNRSAVGTTTSAIAVSAAYCCSCQLDRLEGALCSSRSSSLNTLQHCTIGCCTVIEGVQHALCVLCHSAPLKVNSITCRSHMCFNTTDLVLISCDCCVCLAPAVVRSHAVC
jgi:hypothetical protein